MKNCGDSFYPLSLSLAKHNSESEENKKAEVCDMQITFLPFVYVRNFSLGAGLGSVALTRLSQATVILTVTPSL